MSNFVDVSTGIVADAGQRTAATGQEWSSWGDRIRRVFDLSRDNVQDWVIRGHLETYASDVERGARGVAANIEILGDNTTSAAHTIDHADADAANTLHQQHGGGTLGRPINESVPV